MTQRPDSPDDVPTGRHAESLAALADSVAHPGVTVPPDTTPPHPASPEAPLVRQGEATPETSSAANPGTHVSGTETGRTGDRATWDGSSPAPAGIPQRRTVIRTPRGVGVRAPAARRRFPADGRRPVVGLPLLVGCGLLALFVAWVSAEPFWLAVGHREAGTVEVTRCAGHGELGTRCVGTFSSRRYVAEAVTVSGASPAERETGRRLPAEMVSRDGRIAYVGDPTGLHLRWLLGAGLLLVIGVTVTLVTGTWRLRGTVRAAAVLLSLLAPFLLAATTLALTA